MELNPFQLRAVTTPGHLTVLACPGSGKTRVLSTRAAHLINSNELGRLCAVTFTRDAANELRNRIVDSCGQEHARRLAIGTFHSLALDQERRVNHGKLPRLINDGERHAILKGCWKAFAPKRTYEEILKEIDIAKTMMDGHVFEDEAIELVFKAYEEAMSADNMMDFSDILLRTVRGMRNGTIPPLPLRWLLVDESQDMDGIQMEWILAHARNGTEITLVGDDDQSLYSFRMALGYKGLVTVSQALNSVELTLPVNYRCAPNILEHAAKLIRHNQDRANKNIKAHKEADGEIVVARLSTRHDECKTIVKRLKEMEPMGGWAVLARTNGLLDNVEMALNSKGICTKRSGGKSFWEHGVGAIVLGLLRSIAADAWAGACQCLTHCGLGSNWLSTFNAKRGTCIDKLNMALESAPDEHAKKKVLALREGMISWRYQAGMGRVNLALCGVIDFVRDNSRDSLKPMLDAVKRNLTERGATGTLAQRLERLQRTQEKEVALDENTVHLITLHSSKGLEFDNVWIVGCEEGNLPHIDATEEEERRLMYVGMTRARSRLVVSSAMEEGMESRFLAEAGL